MDVSTLLLQLADPQAIKNLSFLEKMAGGLVVSCLGMGITFLALIILQFIIGLLARFAAPPSPKPLPKTVAGGITAVDEPDGQEEDEELVAIISAAIAMSLQPTGKKVIIRNIRRIKTPSLAWSKAGILDQMNNRF
jgi:glutaconyl-CoA/methylmalonyl-CoA decarboxylase subunit delta